MRGISSLVTVSIIVAISVVVVTFVALWSAGIIGQSGYGTRPSKVALYGDMEAVGSKEAGQFKIAIKNLGSDIVYIESITIDNKYRAEVFQAKTPDGKDRLVKSGDNVLVKLGPGETVYVWALISGATLKAGSVHEVEVRLSNGLTFSKMVNVGHTPMIVGAYEAYNLGILRGDGKVAALLKTTIRNTAGSDLTNGKLEIYVLGSNKPIWRQPLPPEYATIKAGKEVTVDIYFGIPKEHSKDKVIAKLVYREKSGRTIEFAYTIPPPKPLEIYILYIDGVPGSWIDPNKLYNTAKEIVYVGNVKLIDTIDSLVTFFKNADKHRHAIIISTYGESLPGPDKPHDEWGIYDSYTWEGDPGTHDPSVPIYIPVGWKNWFRYVSEQIGKYEMIYVNPIGIFGWYYVTKPDSDDPKESHYDWRPQVVNTGTCCGGNGRFHRDSRWTGTVIEREGLRVFLNDSQVTYTDFPVHGDAKAEESTIKDLERMFNVSLPRRVYDTGSGWSSWRSLNTAAKKHLAILFYDTSEISNDKFPYAAAAYRLGKGFVVLNGWPPVSVLHTSDPEMDAEDFVAKAAIYFAVYTYVKAYILGELS